MIPMEIDSVGVEPKRELNANLPWVEKYRPNVLDQVVAHKEIITTLNKFVEENKLPHLLFYGPPGTGKTSTAVALAHNIFGQKYHSSMVLEMNASDDRGIDAVREQIKTFAATRTFGTAHNSLNNNNTEVEPTKGVTSGLKLVILDEADAMTSAAQNALRRVMEKYVKHVRFIIICNYVGQIIPALQSRCTRFRFAPLPLDCLKDRLGFVAKAEGLTVSSEAGEALIRIAGGDMRRVLNVLQAAAAAYHPAVIDEEAIYAVTAAPHPTDMDQILQWLMNEDIVQAHSYISKLQKERAVALTDIIRAIFDRINVNVVHIPANMRIYLIRKLADIEHKLAVGANESMQVLAMVSAFQLARALPNLQ